ncbi:MULTISPECIES: TauD/TfdA dioxygenase family protein [Phyllobacteriaceae]|jgi:taurine dioxygenase|nr:MULTISPECIES: TauD/TfdA family dioxygenase [Mesorhizobium]MBN9235631.1 TauD/TfdA family dioxygenase [Mesorhizobium sp.]MDQ0331214.1 taurine dioxygenase [Mesorhizobium sp. YL-MeA3-2017]
MPARLRADVERPFEIVTGPEMIGGDVQGISAGDVLDPGNPWIAESLKRALNQYLVLRFRNMQMDDNQLVAFAQLFGPLQNDRHNHQEPKSSQSGPAELKVLSNAVGPDGLPIGDKGAVAQIWHTDGSFKPAPMNYSILYCKKAPANPPRTGFLSAYHVYESLTAELRREIAPLRAIHSLHNRSQGLWDFWEGPSVSVERRAEGTSHPLVRLHSETRRPLLYLPRRRDALIEGKSPEESRNLMERLWAEVFRGGEQFSIALEAEDLVIFDNRAVLHNREGWDSGQERVVVHIAAGEEKPIAAYERSKLLDG